MRIDKYLWAVRLSKTRTSASRLCKSGKVKMNGEEVKPSKELTIGCVIQVCVKPYWRAYRVIDFPKSRVGAKLVADYIKETTDESTLEKIAQLALENRTNRAMGAIGRPTKKNRRLLDKLRDNT